MYIYISIAIHVYKLLRIDISGMLRKNTYLLAEFLKSTRYFEVHFLFSVLKKMTMNDYRVEF